MIHIFLSAKQERESSFVWVVMFLNWSDVM